MWLPLRGAVTLVFDDGYQAVFDHVLPLLRHSGVRAVFAVPVDTDQLTMEEGTPATRVTVWADACRADAHELAAHGMRHRALPSLNDVELSMELQRSRDATSASTLVYPGGALDERVVAATRPLFRAARTVRPGLATVPPRDRYRLPSFVATRENFRVWKWNLRALWAWLTNRWLIETFHNVSIAQSVKGKGQSNDRHTVPLEALERHLRFLKRLPTRIATIRDIVHD